MTQQPDELSLSADDENLSSVDPNQDSANQDSRNQEGSGDDKPSSDVDGQADETLDDELSEVSAVESELVECQSRVLRLQAELENFRKRAQRTLEEERRYAGLPLMRDLLTVLDNLRRAIEHAQENEGAAGLLEGVTMVAEQLTTILKQHHCEEIPAEGAKFDPNLHEAIAQLPSEDHEPGDVTQVTQRGYQLYDRVIRPSQVIVAGAKPEG